MPPSAAAMKCGLASAKAPGVAPPCSHRFATACMHACFHICVVLLYTGAVLNTFAMSVALQCLCNCACFLVRRCIPRLKHYFIQLIINCSDFVGVGCGCIEVKGYIGRVPLYVGLPLLGF